MRLHRRLAAPFLACALFLVAALPAFAAEVTITPAAGSQVDEYVIVGSGLQPGLALDINFVSPDGAVYSTAALDLVVVVDEEGNFVFTFVPAQVFAGESLGTWVAQVCVSGLDDCVQTTFDIAG